jgi:acetylornithine/N-succinyldiaminopimelate aminotransferase
MTEEVNSLLEPGDHGGTFCGNPLGCAVSCAVIEYLIDKRVGEHVE